jgi:hypothetical protein
VDLVSYLYVLTTIPQMLPNTPKEVLLSCALCAHAVAGNKMDDSRARIHEHRARREVETSGGGNEVRGCRDGKSEVMRERRK